MSDNMQLKEKIKGFLRRIDSIEINTPFGGVGIGLGPKDSPPEWQDRDSMLDLRSEASYSIIDNSYVGEFITRILETDQLDFMAVEFSNEKKWLTSRLFLMSVIFERQTGMRAIVFLENKNGIHKKFVGWASPRSVRFALARYNPWLEHAYAEAYAHAVSQENITSNQGLLRNRDSLIALMQKFLELIQSKTPGPEKPDQWVELKSHEGILYEHAEWVKRAFLVDYLSHDRHTSKLKRSQLRSMDPFDQFIEIIEAKGEFIALTGDDGSFEVLLKRTKLLEQFTKELMKDL
ncbi:hypothetical protein [Paenibacillus montanisoli]|uniref:Uncharacterized protein n=1 Tax=Paenibacillus montanisoli TaxID=2081970 RepID=A0A328TXD3_9BACL|nr:hypothetical protein [Paenibacillus montanisoli]RAP74352.1 hypothetical protein DL346_19910 [Paenibacillus montanisoli]